MKSPSIRYSLFDIHRLNKVSNPSLRINTHKETVGIGNIRLSYSRERFRHLF